ncbi:5940_t:CDS:2 [Acaulospora morrowiae]|uniref:5940_t:CDS:1 n=1 Tax=Acaulospora morrowiae TaxID=94023 RepID=A0A9N9I6B7_9GLOM|nr:5940_t:CDS:2 [Acaulospora morrowiae]
MALSSYYGITIISYNKKDWINVIDAFVKSYNSTIHRAHETFEENVDIREISKKTINVQEILEKDNDIQEIPKENINIQEILEEDVNMQEISEEDTNIQEILEKNVDMQEIFKEDDNISEVVEQHISRVLQIYQSVNSLLEKYRDKLC